MAKMLEFDEEARRSLERVVWTGLWTPSSYARPEGPQRRHRQEWVLSTITNDGVTVAREVELEDPYENLALQPAKEVATKTNDVAGDGTTMVILLAQAMVHEGLVLGDGGEPHCAGAGIDVAAAAVFTRLLRVACEVEEQQEIAHVATALVQDGEDRRADRRGVRQGRQGR